MWKGNDAMTKEQAFEEYLKIIEQVIKEEEKIVEETKKNGKK